MRIVPFPDTDLQVSSICLGSADIGSKIDRTTSFQILDRFVDFGGTFIDTASVYANWLPGPTSVSEKTIGEWFERSGKRDQVVIATKGGHPDLRTMHISRLSRQEIEQDVDASLQNLRTDVIDFYWLHRDDPALPVGDMLEVLADQVKAGKIRWYGCSNWRAERIAEAQSYAAANNLSGFSADQMMWSLAVIDSSAIQDKTTVAMDGDLYGYHMQTDLPAVPYSSQAGGLFQKIAAGTVDQMPAARRAVYDSGENRARYVRVRELAERRSLSITAIVLGYMQSQPFVTTPIVGCRSIEQLEDSVSAGDVQLTDREVAFLEGRSDLL